MSFNAVVGGVVRHITYCTIAGQVSTNKRDWQITSLTGGSSISSVALLNALDGPLATLFTDQMPVTATYYGSQLYYQTPVGPKPRPSSVTLNQGPGLQVTDMLPTQTCGLISFFTNQLGKAGQGRMYMPFPYVGAMDANGTPNAGYLTGLNNMGTFFTNTHNAVDGAVTAVLQHVLYIPGGPPPLPITSYLARDAWATQRRRGSFGRLNNAPF